MGLLRYYDQAELPPNVKAEAEAIKTRIHFNDTVNDLGSIIADCREGTTRIKDIVQNLRTFSRLDEAEFKKTDIHEGIDSTIRLLSRYLSGGNINLVRDYGNIPAIEAYSAQLNQVWMNLLVNAAQAVGGVQGELRVTTHSDGTNVTVSVSDTGNGIEPDVLSKIFDPFFTTKPVGEGTGLGLSITFGIVERHGGKIEVNSELNKGTTFSVILPRSIAHNVNTNVDATLTLNQTYAI
jgi:two-component system NtrC family sensor kinase